MPWPAEYQRATDHFYSFLMDAKTDLDVGSTHMVYTTVQGVFQCFRRRITIEDAIKFANTMPVGMRALFIADWDPGQERVPFADVEVMIAEVKALRKEHNFAPDNAINAVANAVKRHVDLAKFEAVLKEMSPEAQRFWGID